MGAAYTTETLTLPLAIAQRQDELLCYGTPWWNRLLAERPFHEGDLRCQRLERLNLTECLVQEAVRRARLQALAFEQLLSLPEMARGLCHCWGLKATRAFAAVAKSSGNSVRCLLPKLHAEAVPEFYVLGGCLATTELASVQYYDPSKDCWQLLPTMPTQRRWCAGAALHGQIYVIGGQQEGHVLNTAERFDVDTRRWETLPDMPSCREACAVAACGSYLYVLGGCQHDLPLAAAERFDVNNLEWETLSDMPCSRDACCATSLGGRVYVMGGRSSGHFLASADLLCPSETATSPCRWSRLPPMPTARLGCFAAAAKGSVYVAGGHAGRGRALSVVERFDVGGYFWELLTEMPSARLGAVCLCWQPSMVPGTRKVQLYIFGGHNGQGAIEAAERLLLDSDGISNPRWETLSPMLTPCYACAGAVLAW